MRPTATILKQSDVEPTINSLSGFNLQIIDDDKIYDYSKKRNSLIADGWNLHINSWEILIDENSTLLKLKNPKAYYFQVIENGIVSKEVRYWHSSLNLRFENPIYETISCKNAEFIDDVIIYSKGRKPYNPEIIKKWKESSPLSIQPYYYESFIHLSNNKYKEFVKTAKYYLLHNLDNTMSAIMLKYYISMVNLYALNDFNEIIPNLMHCIAANPLMAEFWCLLGDFSYKSKNYSNAKSFYENAIILGSKRLKSDWWSLEIDKYKTYPENMIKSLQ